MEHISLIILEMFFVVTIFILLLLYTATINAELEREKYKGNITSVKETIDNQVYENSSKIKTDLDLLYLKDISKNDIDLLLLDEINNIMDLKRKISTEKDITEYSEKLGKRKKLVQEWVRFGEFSRLHGINRDYIKLFEKIDIKTIIDLSKQDPNELLKKLSQIEKNETLPSIGMISYWIRNAEKIEDQYVHANKINI